jgi:hypothetical protein
VNSEKSDGRSVISNAASGWFKVEIGRSDIALSMENTPPSGKRDYIAKYNTWLGERVTQNNGEHAG